MCPGHSGDTAAHEVGKIQGVLVDDRLHDGLGFKNGGCPNLKDINISAVEVLHEVPAVNLLLVVLPLNDAVKHEGLAVLQDHRVRVGSILKHRQSDGEKKRFESRNRWNKSIVQREGGPLDRAYE